MIYTADEIDADEVYPGLWQGSVPPRGNRLAREGFGLVVLAAREWQLFDETFEGVEVVRAPLDDDELVPIPRADLAGALKAARRTAEAVANGTKCLVTCAAGVNRSGLISALTLHLLNDWPGSKCIKVVQERRLASGVLSNARFRAVLLRLR